MATKTKRYDLETIFTASQSLNTYDSNKKTKKGWSELNYAASTLDKPEYASGNRMDMVAQKALRLFSQHSFDAEGLMREVNSMELKAQYAPVERLEGTDIEGYLSHHHDMIILSAIDESRKIAEEDANTTQKKWAADEWATSRRQLMDSLGHRSNFYESRKSQTTSLAPTPLQICATPHSIGKDMSSIYLQTPGSAISQSIPVSAPQTPVPSQPTPFATNQKNVRTHLEQSDLMRKHADVVRYLRTNPTDKQSQRTPNGLVELSAVVALPNNKGFNPSSSLANQLEGSNRSSGLLSDAQAVGMKEGDLAAYRNLLHLFASMTGECEGKSYPPGYFSPVSLDHPSLSGASISERRRILSLGSRMFLEKQFENMLIAKVDNNRTSLLGADDSGLKSCLERIRVFTSLKSKARQIPSACSRCVDNPMAFGIVPPSRGVSRSSSGDVYSGIPVWPQVYFCLRTGALKDAQSLLKVCLDEGIGGIDEAAYIALGQLIKLNERGDIHRPHQISNTLVALSKCNSLYRESINSIPSGIDALNNSQSIDESYQPDPYRLQVLSLLGLVDLDALCNGTYLPDTTVEDFLWTSLWFVHWTQTLSSAFTEQTALPEDAPPTAPPTFSQSKSYTAGSKSTTSTSFSALQSPGRISSTTDRLKTRYDLIDPLTQPTTLARDRHLTPSGIRQMHTEHLPKVFREGDIYLRVMDAGGADYFDPGMSSPFTYSLILFCCHHFEEAIAHLWQAGRSFPAIHLLVIGLHYGLILPHLPLSNSGSVSRDDSVGDMTPSSLLSLWISSKYAPLDPTQKIDYILSLNSKWIAYVRELDTTVLEICRNKSDVALMKALENFISSLDSSELTQLLGEENISTGVRVSGYLDIYLDREVIHRVLAQTAYSLLTTRRDISRGIFLYELSGMYVEVLEELCQQLSLIVMVTSSSYLGRSQERERTSARTYWKEYCEKFYQKMTSPSSRVGGIITERLQQAGRLNLRVLFETLLNLCLFVDFHQEKRYQEALDLLDNLRLLPTRADVNGEEGFSSCAQKFARLESPVKRIMDDVIIMAMDCIYNLYATAKIEGPNQRGGESVGLLQILRRRASSLVTFTGYVQHLLIRPAETAQKLSEVEVRMM